MTICPYDHHACSCQPDEGVPCRGTVMTQIDELVKDARIMAIAMDKTFADSNAANTWRAVANALEAQAAREALLCEDLQHMESLAEEYLASSNAQAARVKELEADVRHYKTCYDAAIKTHDESVDRIATLEAQLEAFREALKPFADMAVYMSHNHLNNDDEAMVHVKLGDCNKADRALMSALRNTEAKDGVELEGDTKSLRCIDVNAGGTPTYACRPRRSRRC